MGGDQSQGDTSVCALRVGEAKVLQSWQFAIVNDGVYERPRTSKLKRGTEGALPETADDKYSVMAMSSIITNDKWVIRQHGYKKNFMT